MSPGEQSHNWSKTRLKSSQFMDKETGPRGGLPKETLASSLVILPGEFVYNTPHTEKRS